VRANRVRIYRELLPVDRPTTVPGRTVGRCHTRRRLIAAMTCSQAATSSSLLAGLWVIMDLLPGASRGPGASVEWLRPDVVNPAGAPVPKSPWWPRIAMHCRWLSRVAGRWLLEFPMSSGTPLGRQTPTVERRSTVLLRLGTVRRTVLGGARRQHINSKNFHETVDGAYGAVDSA